MDKYIGFDIACKKTVACVVQKGKPDNYDTLPTDVKMMRLAVVMCGCPNATVRVQHLTKAQRL